MKILIFTLEFPPMVGGAGTYAYELALGLNSLGNDVTLLTSNREIQREPSFDKNLEKFGINVKRFIWIDKVWIFYWGCYLKQMIKRDKYDKIIFANQGAIIIGAQLHSLAIPYLCTLHGSERYTFLSDRSTFRQSILIHKNRIIRFLIEAEKVICVSRDLFIDISEKYPSFNTEVIPLGIGSDFLLKEKIENNSNVIACTGRLVPQKGQDTLLQACALLKAENFEFHLIIVGDGPDRTRLELLVKQLDLEKHVTFKGVLNRQQLANLYMSVDVFALISRFKETFGLCYLEAMMSGIPAIGSNLGAVPEIIKHDFNGYLVEDNSVLQTASSIKMALVERRRLGSNAMESALKFSNITMAQKHLDHRK